MKHNDLNELIDNKSKELTDRELLEKNFTNLHLINQKLNSIEKRGYWLLTILVTILLILLYEFPPLWLR